MKQQGLGPLWTEEEIAEPTTRQEPIEYQVPYCHNRKMVPAYRGKSSDGCLYRSFTCIFCGWSKVVKITKEVKKRNG
jgi:hypothetical protein